MVKKIPATECYLSGKAMWAKLIEPEKDTKYGKSDWKIDVILDDDQWDKFNKLGLSLKVREDKKTGDKFITLRRPTHKEFSGETTMFDPPEVLDSNGKKLDKLIGNGSEIDVKITIYSTKDGKKGHRLEAVRVNKLNEYVPKEVIGADDISPF